MADEQQTTNITLQTLNTELHLGASDDLLTRLKENQIESLGDVRSKGGLADLDGVAESDRPVIRTLEAHAQLSLLAETPTNNAKLIDRGFANPIQIADTPRRDFVSAVGDELGAVKAEQIHAKATAQNRLLNNIITDIRARAANSIALSEEEQPIYDAIRAATGDRAECKDCQSAVSPLAYLADLIGYALKNIVLAPSSASGTGLRGEYYDDLDFRNLVLSRVDPAIDFTWGDDAPAPVLQADTFSVRWSGYLEPEFSEEYTFRTEADDGVRFWVNRKLLIDQWKDQPGAMSYTGKMSLEAGRKYPVTMEYYENQGAASATLRWSSASRPEEIIPTNRLYPSLDLQFLTDRLHQPLGELPVSCEALEKKVRQVRICVEVLRSYLKSRILGPSEIEKIEAAGAAYCLAAYQGLLTRLGTSYAELRAARTADQSARRALADRLGIVLTEPRPALESGGDELDRLFLLPKSDSASKSLDEQNLEVLFGLADTRRDPLSEGAKLGDDHMQIRRWNLDGVQWGINTDDEGRVFVRLSRSQPENHYLVQVYRDAARTELQASGTRDTATGTVVLQSVNANGLTGVFEIACSQDGDEAIEIAAVPAFLAWRLRYLRDTWLRQDFPLDAYSPDASAAETTKVLPLIDPDLIGPDDFRHPDPNDDKAFELWAKRRAWVDQRLHGFAAFEQKTIPLATAYFNPGKAWLEDETRDSLYSFKGMFAGAPKLVLRLEGHADSVEATSGGHTTPLDSNIGWAIASDEEITEARLEILFDAKSQIAGVTTTASAPEEASQEIAEARAMMVANFFFYYDVADRDRLRPTGFGASRPVATNDTDDGRAKNRRVELIPCTLLETLSGLRGAGLTKDHKAALDRLVPRFQANPLMIVYVDGHADPDGDPQNLDISKQRAQAVAGYLRQQGVSSHQLRPAWFGEMCPRVVPNDTEAAKRANRRVELVLAERAVPDWGKLVSSMGGVDYQGSVEPFWNETPENLDKLHADLELAEDSGRRDDARKRVTDQLKLTLESFARLMAVREEALRWEEDPAAAKRAPAEEWGEVFSILTQAQKEFLYRRWRREEADAGVLLGTKTFWSSLQEPAEGAWPAVEITGSPFIDPELLKLTELPEPTAGRMASDIWNRRTDELKTIATSLRSKPKTAAGLEAMLKQALGDPLPEDLDRLHEDLENGDLNASDEAKNRIEQHLYLSEEQFRRLMAIRSKARSDKSARKPTDGEWTEIHALLTTVKKRRERYPAWDTEERQTGLVYWRALKATLPRWRSNAEARGAWRQALRERSRAPIVDSDLISEEYIKPVTRPDSLLPSLWAARRDEVQRWLDELRAKHADGQSPDALLRGFADSVHQIVGIPVQDLLILDKEKVQGKSIGKRLEQLDLSYETFTYLLRIHTALDKKEAGAILTSEWDDVDSMLVQARKQREFAAWREQERSGKLSLSPDHFRFPASPATDILPPASVVPLPAWRGTDSARREWEQTLQGRIDQKDATIAAANEAVSATEEETLPLLRDGLIILDDPAGATALPQKGKLLTYSLLVDMAMGGCSRTTRVAQASETIQSLLWSLRTGLLLDTLPALKLPAETFDDEWQWIGSYDNWRSAQSVYLYPENILQPSLRRHQTLPFKKLIESLRSSPRLTPQRARELAADYALYFRDVCNLDVQACIARLTPVNQDEAGPGLRETHLLVHLFARSTASHRVYWSVVDTESPNRDYGQTFWGEVRTGKREVLDLIGASVYTPNLQQQWLYLFYRTQEGGQQYLLFIRYDFNFGLWDTDATTLPLPQNTTSFRAWVRPGREDAPPDLAIQLTEDVIYSRQLNHSGNDWDTVTFQRILIQGEWRRLGRQSPQRYLPDFDCGDASIKSRYVLSGDFDGDGRDEIAVAPLLPGTAGNDLWVMKFSNGVWDPLPMLDCAGANVDVAAAFAVVGDFDGDGRDEIAVAADFAGDASRGNDLWVQRFDGTVWQPLGQIPGHPIEACIDCSAEEIWAKYAVVGDFDGDGREEIALALQDLNIPNPPQNSFNAFWVVDFENGAWSIIKNTSNPDYRSSLDKTFGASFRCSPAPVAASFAVSGDFDGDGRDEIAVALAPDPNGLTRGNDFWVIGYRHGVWQPLGPVVNDELKTVFDCSSEDISAAFAVVGDFDGDGRDEIAIGPFVDDSTGPGSLLWVADYMPPIGSDPNAKGSWSFLPVIDLRSRGLTAAFAVAGDFDGDGRDEIAIAALSSDSRGNDFWIMDLTYDPAAGIWQWWPLPLLDCSPADIGAAFAVAGDFDGDDRKRDEIAVAPGTVIRVSKADPVSNAAIREYRGSAADNSFWVRGFDVQGSPPGPQCDDHDATPKFSGPYEITDDLDANKHRNHTQAAVLANANGRKSNLAYVQEAFYFVPIAIALQLQRAGQYVAALDWFRTVYDYSAPVEVIDGTRIADTRKIYYGLELEQRLGTPGYPPRSTSWLLDPLDPHAIADTRRGAYTRYTLFSLIRCILDYADAEFTRDTNDSVARARDLYLTALEILDVPDLKAGTARVAGVTLIASENRNIPKSLTLRDLFEERSIGTRTSHSQLIVFAAIAPAVSSIASYSTIHMLHVADARNPMISSDAVEAPSANAVKGNEIARPVIGWTPIPSDHFCVVANPILKSLQLRANLNVRKLRTCRNIAGMKRELKSFSAVEQDAYLPAIGTSGQLVLKGAIRIQPTPYRYATLIERAKQLVQFAVQVEVAFLSALEKRDKEAYDLLTARANLSIGMATVRLQTLRIKEARGAEQLAELQTGRARIHEDHYKNLRLQGTLPSEEQALENLRAARDWAVAATVAAGLPIALAAVAAASVSGGAAAPIGAGAGMVAQAAMGSLSAVPSGIAQVNSLNSQINTMRASQERREQDWALQQRSAAQDILIANQQTDIARHNVLVVEQELLIEQIKADHAKEVLDFLTTKFTGIDLYDWMSGILERVYSFFLQQATALAKLAADQLAFERQELPPPFIQADYWEPPSDNNDTRASDKAPDRRGLTGSARLLQDIYQLDQYGFETNKRKHQLTKTLSLSRLDPVGFQQFRENGVMIFGTPLDLFDRDFPGHYLRLIRRVRVSVVALIPPTQGIRATLSSSGVSRVVVGGDLFQPIVIRRDPESVALTSPLNTTGLFELEQQSEMLFPFEANGVDTTWEFSMPKAANPFDFDTIADVLITIEYTALNSFDYRQQVIQQLDRNISADRAFSFRQQFADAWFVLNNPDLTGESAEMVVSLNTARVDFPPNADALKIQHVVLYFARANGWNFEVPISSFRFTDDEGTGSTGGAATSFDGVISTRRGNAGSWLGMQGKKPFGKWELALPNTEEMRNRFRNEEIEDILFVITYSGQTPEWPT